MPCTQSVIFLTQLNRETIPLAYYLLMVVVVVVVPVDVVVIVLVAVVGDQADKVVAGQQHRQEPKSVESTTFIIRVFKKYFISLIWGTSLDICIV